MLLGWPIAGRSAELVDLDFLRPGARANGGSGFLSFAPKGLQVTLLTSKASQMTPKEFAICDGELPFLRPWRDRWLEHARVQPGEPLFRPIDRFRKVLPARLAADGVAKIVRTRMLAHAQAMGCGRRTRLSCAGPSVATPCTGATARLPPSHSSLWAKSVAARPTAPTPC